MPPTFADISSNNGRVDLGAYARAGYKAIAIKATEGVNYVNPYFAAQRQQAHDLGLFVLPYHFDSPGVSAAVQADHFLSTLGGLRPNEKPVDDTEGGGWRPGEANEHVHTFAAACGCPGLSYLSESFIGEHGMTLPTGWGWWVAKYSTVAPRVPYVAWQYTERGSAPGLGDGTVDLSTYTPALLDQGDEVTPADLAAIGNLIDTKVRAALGYALGDIEGEQPNSMFPQHALTDSVRQIQADLAAIKTKLGIA